MGSLNSANALCDGSLHVHVEMIAIASYNECVLNSLLNLLLDHRAIVAWHNHDSLLTKHTE